MTYECETTRAFDHLKHIESFNKFVRFQYTHICFAKTRLRPTISNYNLDEAFGSFNKDIQELSTKENDGGDLERVKVAAFLAYWLRRCSPISAVIGSVSLADETTRLPKEELVIHYANEFCAFDLGFRMCRAVEAMKTKNTGRYIRSSTLQEQNGELEKDIREYKLDRLSDYILPTKYLIDTCQLLKEKNVSPHSLYLIYKGLFLRLQP